MICARCKTKCDDNITYCLCCGNKLKVNPNPKENDKDATVFVDDIDNDINDDSGTIILTENNDDFQDDIKTYLISDNDESTVLLTENEVSNSNMANETITSMEEDPNVNTTSPTLSPSTQRAPLKIPVTLYVGLAIVVIALIAVIVLL